MVAGCCSHLHHLLWHPGCPIPDGLRSAEMAGVIPTAVKFAFQILSEMVPGSALLEVCAGTEKIRICLPKERSDCFKDSSPFRESHL